MKVLVKVESEDQSYLFYMTKTDADRCRVLLQRALEFPQEVNDILDRSEVVTPYGNINTMGDGWGWYNEDQ